MYVIGTIWHRQRVIKHHEVTVNAPLNVTAVVPTPITGASKAVCVGDKSTV